MDPKLLHDLMAIIKGFRNGLVYGAKVRFPHALVMTFLFQSGSY
jgi:peroxisomal membrane protein 4